MRASELPYMPLYTGDFLRISSAWTCEECGAFLKLWIAQWETGRLPTDPARLSRIIGGQEVFERVWEAIGAQFVHTQDETGVWLINRPLDDLRQKQMQFREKQRQGGRAGGLKSAQMRRTNGFEGDLQGDLQGDHEGSLKPAR